ncbi:hypothetical protein ACSFA2_05785 [Variovorax sp. LT2P21]|uniref:hypothetical protein n=1 Tax=Variovorax sp. LT2P21 TaxID=3443731 RepID=UPI003F44D4C8
MNTNRTSHLLAASTIRTAFAAVLLALLAACGGRGNDSVPAPVGTPTATALATGPGTVPPPASAASAPTLAQQIASLERSGAYPTLDRTSDITGPDSNANGVRDDIETWINAQPVNDGQRRALMQKARSLQRTLTIDLKDQAALQKADDGLAASSKCGGDNFPDYAMFSKFAGKIEAMTANTKERAARYMQYNAARSGSSTTRPSGDACEL